MRNSSDPGTYPQSLIDDPDFLREIVERAVQAVLDISDNLLLSNCRRTCFPSTQSFLITSLDFCK